jgi:hypothetical protein
VKALCYVDANGLLQALPGCPFTIIHDLIPEAWVQSKIVPWNLILHSNAGPRKTHGSSLQDYMERSDINIECHANIETEPDGRGLFRQIMPFTTRADCNAKANAWYAGGQNRGAISFETQDDGASALPYTNWTPGQLQAITHAAAALNVAYGIPPVHTPTWDGRGIDGHAKFKEWSVYVGKTCPGAARFAQIPAIHAEVERLLSADPIVEDDDVKYMIKDTRAPYAVWLSDGVIKTWVNSGHVAPYIEFRKPVIVETSNNDEIASYGPIVGPQPGHPFDGYGRLV